MPVYFITDADNSAVNIGWHDNPRTALAELQARSKKPLRLARVQSGGGATAANLMVQWAHCALGDGWFRYDPAMFQLINPMLRPAKPKEDLKVFVQESRAARNAMLDARPVHPVIADRARIMRHVKLAGGSAKLAAMLNVSSYAVHYWLKNGLSNKALRMLDRLENGAHAAAKRNKIA